MHQSEKKGTANEPWPIYTRMHSWIYVYTKQAVGNFFDAPNGLFLLDLQTKVMQIDQIWKAGILREGRTYR